MSDHAPLRRPRAPDMHSQNQQRGGAPVGMVDDLGPLESAAVLFLRLWSDGAEGREKVLIGFEAALGEKAGARATADFAQLYDLCLHYGRRALVRHDVACRCLGADESCFGTFLAAAVEAPSEDAALIATLIVRPDMALPLAGLAQNVGLSLLRVGKASAPPLRTGPHPQNTPTSTRLH
ncbi:MAG: hypothetical protein ACRBBK_07170 [Paracoccaceae bacterium]